MLCLRCGVETPEKQVFCDKCLATMDKYPVKPDTVVQLPRHRAPVAPKKPVKKKLSAEEQLLISRKICRRLVVALSVVTILLGICAYGLIRQLTLPPEQTPVQGRNYTINTSQN